MIFFEKKQKNRSLFKESTFLLFAVFLTFGIISGVLIPVKVSFVSPYISSQNTEAAVLSPGGFTIVNPAGTITTSATSITWTSLYPVNLPVGTYAYEQITPSFSDYTYDFEFELTGGSSSHQNDGHMFFAGVGDTAGSVCSQSNYIGVDLYYAPHCCGANVNFAKEQAGVESFGGNFGISPGVLYYGRITRTGTTATLTFYSDAARTSSVGSASMTVPSIAMNYVLPVSQTSSGSLPCYTGDFYYGKNGGQTSGFMQNQNFTAVIPCVPTYGNACTSAPNACGSTNSGTINCSGNCTATTPPNPPNYGNACTSAPNACGSTNSGTINCSGSCTATTPADPPNLGNVCNSSPNDCGQTSAGTIVCPGSCNAIIPSDPPLYGNACTSTPNSCGMTNSGTINCFGLCTATTPPNSSCTNRCVPASNCTGNRPNTANCYTDFSTSIATRSEAACCMDYYFGATSCLGSKASPCPPWGDVDGSSLIDSFDMWAIDNGSTANADVNKDGIVNSLDNTMIDNYLRGSITTFTACPPPPPAPALATVKMKPMASLISSLLDSLLATAAGFALLFLIIGGIRYIRSWGDSEQMEKAKNMINYAVIGLVIVLISYSIVVTINMMINI